MDETAVRTRKWTGMEYDRLVVSGLHGNLSVGPAPEIEATWKS